MLKAFKPLVLFLELFFSLTSYLSCDKSDNQAPGLTISKHFCINLGLFLGLCGSLQLFIAMKSSSFSLLDNAMKNLGSVVLPFSSVPQPKSNPFPSKGNGEPLVE
uniref:Uncharacterized protein n=1 Tax=Arundo donax TaxID=35708 RepID=A0A0A9D2D8_ARUDO